MALKNRIPSPTKPTITKLCLQCLVGRLHSEIDRLWFVLARTCKTLQFVYALEYILDVDEVQPAKQGV
jgi:hypothetical protein